MSVCRKTLIVLIAAAVLCLLCAGASAAVVDSGSCGTGVTWSLDDGGVLTIAGNGAMDDNPWCYEGDDYPARIKKVVVGEGVTAICDRAFLYCNQMTEISIASTVREIGQAAFWGCHGLTEVTVPAGVRSLGMNAFYFCRGLEKLTIRGDAVSVGESALGSYKGFLYFTGKAPTLAEDAFSWGKLIVVYPHGDDSWTGVINQNYGASNIVWCADNAESGAGTDTPPDASGELTAGESDNADDQDYGNYSDSIYSFLTPNEDGTFWRVECKRYDGVVLIEKYSESMTLTWTKTLEMELPLWGGFYAGKDYFFLVEGQRNDEEDDNKEVIRVIRYTKNWHRKDDARILGHNTTNPFDAGSLRMIESGNFLNIHTSHQMYTSSDGRRHESNLSFKIYIPTMSVTDDADSTYVSHSFNQFVLTDGKDIIKVDHGDAYPRSVVLHKLPNAAGRPGASDAVEEVDLLKITGEAGDNYTGVTVGGLIASGSHYIVTGLSIDQSQFGTNRMQNLYTVSVPKNNLKEDQVRFRWITNYTDGVTMYTPHLVRIDSNRALLMWSEGTGRKSFVTEKEFRYAFLDGSGALSSEIYTAPGRLSDCTPTLRGGKVFWYVTENSTPVFYCLDTANPSVVTRHANMLWIKLTDGTWVYYDGDGKEHRYDKEPVESVELEQTEISHVRTSDSLDFMDLKAKVLPELEGNQEVTWSSDNTRVANVNAYGTVFVLSEGTANIICTSVTDPTKKAACRLTVTNLPISSITLDRTEAELVITDEVRNPTMELTATVTPENACNPDVDWTSSDPTVAQAGHFGTVYAMKAGTVTVVCSAQDGSGVTASCTVTVRDMRTNPGGDPDPWNPEPVEWISPEGDRYEITANGTAVFIAPADPEANSAIIPASVTLADGTVCRVTEIRANAFKNNKKLKKVTVGNNIRKIGKNAFNGCAKLATVTLGKNLEEIGDGAFQKCTALKKITIPAKVRKIGKNAFNGCKKLKEITIKTKKLTKDGFGKNCFKGIASKAKFKAPKQKLADYEAWLKKPGGAPKTVKVTK